MLYAATLTNDADAKEKIYKTTTEVYPSDARAYNNIASIEYAKGNLDAAKSYIEQARKVNGKLPEAAANLGLIALANGDIQTAENYISQAIGANGLSEAMGNLNLAKGNFAQAEDDFKEVYSNSAALAQIMNKDYASAAVTLKYINNPDATTDYLKAVLAARIGDTAEAAEALRTAASKDARYAKYAVNDLELKNVAK